MKNRYRILILVILIFCLALPSANVMARGFAEGKVVFGGTYQLESSQSLDGDLVIFGAVATLEEGSTVKGNVILLGANLEASGNIRGDVVGIGGLITLNESAVVDGDVLTLGAHLDKSKGAFVLGEVTDISKTPFSFNFPGEVNIPQASSQFYPELNFAWYMLKNILWAALATLVVLFAPKASGRVTHAFIQQPLVATGLGLLTVVLAFPLAAVFIITIILFPLGLFILLVFGLSWAFGLIAIGLEIGKRFGSLVKREWADPVSAALGTFFLLLVLNGTKAMVPCVGWMLPAAVGMVGLGAVLMTRFGTQYYPLVSEGYSPRPPTAPPAPYSIGAPETDVEKPSQVEKQPDKENDVSTT